MDSRGRLSLHEFFRSLFQPCCQYPPQHRLHRMLKTLCARGSRPQRLKPALKNRPLIAAVNRCATQNQTTSRSHREEPRLQLSLDVHNTSDHSTEMRSPVTLPATSNWKLPEGS